MVSDMPARELVDTLDFINNTNKGLDWIDEIRQGQDAMLGMACRGVANDNRFVFTESELESVNLAMKVHDLQLNVCTVAELEKALSLVRDVIKRKRARVIA